MLLAHDVLLAAPKTVRQTPVKSENERCYLRVQLTFAAQDRSLERSAHTGRYGWMKRDQMNYLHCPMRPCLLEVKVPSGFISQITKANKCSTLSFPVLIYLI